MSAPVIIPAGVVLRGTASQVFIADQSVTWSASAGQIAYNGRYTPPNVAGTYTVTATNAGGESTIVVVAVEGVLVLEPGVGTEAETKKRIDVSESGGRRRHTRRRSAGLRHVRIESANRQKTEMLVLREFFAAHYPHKPFWWYDPAIEQESEYFFEAKAQVIPESFDWFDLKVSLRERRNTRTPLALPGGVWPFMPDYGFESELDINSLIDDAPGDGARAARPIGGIFLRRPLQFTGRTKVEFLAVERYWDYYYSGVPFAAIDPVTGTSLTWQIDSNLRWQGTTGGLIDYGFAVIQF